MKEEMFKICQERFATHKATLIQDTYRYLAIDWRKGNGSRDYYVNYILDKKCGSLFISGDLGDCMATWYNSLDVTHMKSFVNDVPYFMGKCQCMSDNYTYYEEDIMADIQNQLKDFDIAAFVNDEWIGNIDDFWQTVEDEVSKSTSRLGKFLPTDELIKIISELDCDYFRWLYSCGKRIHPRVYLRAVGFQMACEQLGL